MTCAGFDFVVSNVLVMSMKKICTGGTHFRVDAAPPVWANGLRTKQTIHHESCFASHLQSAFRFCTPCLSATQCSPVWSRNCASTKRPNCCDDNIQLRV